MAAPLVPTTTILARRQLATHLRDGLGRRRERVVVTVALPRADNRRLRALSAGTAGAATLLRRRLLLARRLSSLLTRGLLRLPLVAGATARRIPRLVRLLATRRSVVKRATALAARVAGVDGSTRGHRPRRRLARLDLLLRVVGLGIVVLRPLAALARVLRVLVVVRVVAVLLLADTLLVVAEDLRWVRRLLVWRLGIDSSGWLTRVVRRRRSGCPPDGGCRRSGRASLWVGGTAGCRGQGRRCVVERAACQPQRSRWGRWRWTYFMLLW